MKTYKGDRTIDGIVVTVDDQPLDERHDIMTLSEDGFEWSFEGTASAQLALAILADHLDDNDRALRLHRKFMQQVVANFANEWELTSSDLDDAVAALERR